MFSAIPGWRSWLLFDYFSFLTLNLSDSSSFCWCDRNSSNSELKHVLFHGFLYPSSQAILLKHLVHQPLCSLIIMCSLFCLLIWLWCWLAWFDLLPQRHKPGKHALLAQAWRLQVVPDLAMFHGDDLTGFIAAGPVYTGIWCISGSSALWHRNRIHVRPVQQVTNRQILYLAKTLV